MFNENQISNFLRPQNFNRLTYNDNRSSINHLNIGRNPKLLETSSLRSFNSSFGDSSSLLSLNVVSNSGSYCKDNQTIENQNISENYLLLDRVNQRQRQKQILQSKKDLHRQQLNELKHKQLNLEQKFIQPKKQETESDVFNSKLASHYSLNSKFSKKIDDFDRSYLNNQREDFSLSNFFFFL